jgi:hypothetical protein
MTEEPPLPLTCPKCGAPLIAAADLQSTDVLKCPKHGDIGTLSEFLDQALHRQMGNALNEAFKKAMMTPPEIIGKIHPTGPSKPWLFPDRRPILARYEARRLAVNITKLPELIREKRPLS